jgi:nucleoid-associated protein YgaU
VQALTDANEKMRREQGRLSDENTKLTVEKQAAAESVLAAERALVAPADWKKEREALRLQVQDLTTKFADAEQRTAQLKKAGDVARDEAAAAKSETEKIRTELAGANQQGSRVGELTTALEKLTKENAELQKQLAGMDALRVENGRLAELEKALAEAQQRAAALASADTQLAGAQRDLAGLRAENARLTSSVQAQEQDRRNQMARLQQENTAMSARLRQAQGTLDQIAAAARVVNGGAIPAFVASPPSGTSATAGVATAVSAGRIYTVAEGDSLTRISVRYYGTGGRWQEIYDANRDVLRGQNALRVGQQLRVP